VQISRGRGALRFPHPVHILGILVGEVALRFPQMLAYGIPQLENGNCSIRVANI
jgi:hypothetical protein